MTRTHPPDAEAATGARDGLVQTPRTPPLAARVTASVPRSPRCSPVSTPAFHARHGVPRAPRRRSTLATVFPELRASVPRSPRRSPITTTAFHGRHGVPRAPRQRSTLATVFPDLHASVRRSPRGSPISTPAFHARHGVPRSPRRRSTLATMFHGPDAVFHTRSVEHNAAGPRISPMACHRIDPRTRRVRFSNAPRSQRAEPAGSSAALLSDSAT